MPIETNLSVPETNYRKLYKTWYNCLMGRPIEVAIKQSSSRQKSSFRRIATALACIVFIVAFATMCANNVFADDDNIVETTFFGNLKDDGKGCGIYTVLNLVVDILSMGIGIVGVIGIMVAGIQYLTAKSNEEQVRKAKRRIFEIVLGIVAYVLLYAGMQWLLPGGKLNTTPCSTVDEAELAQIRAQQEANRQQYYNSNNQQSANQSSGGSNTLPVLSAQISKSYTPEQMANKIAKGKIAGSPVCTDCTWSERIAQTATLLSWPLGTPSKKYHHNGLSKSNKSWSDLKGAKPNKAFQNAIDAVWPKHNFTSVTNVGADCGVFVGVAIRYSGFDTKSTYSCPSGIQYYTNSKKWKKVSKAERGDVCVKSGCHTRIYLGNNLSAEANHYGKNFGHIIKGGCSGYQVFRANVK